MIVEGDFRSRLSFLYIKFLCIFESAEINSHLGVTDESHSSQES